MVKLRVAARIIPELDYNEARSTQSTDRKFLVVVRNPEEWYIGTLAVEVQNTYKRIYKHDLGRVKYLKDADDFDLDPDQIVSDVFVNEGKADRDGLDQEATIKIIQEQGQAVRQGSVVPDLTPVHYQKRPLPPVPRFSEVPQTLGKRHHDLLNGRNIPPRSHGMKRFRQAEVYETQDEDDLIPSVERSPELIEDTQASQGDLRNTNVKLESPGLPRSFRDVAPANDDELELLPKAPPNFRDNRRTYVLGGEHLTTSTNGVLQNAARTSSAANRQSQLPITPPTDPAAAGPTLGRSAVNGHSHGSGSPAHGALSAAKKFKPPRQGLYEMPESDIEDSQMSPEKDSLPVPRLVKKMSSIEDMPSQQQSSYGTFNAQAALDPMDLDEEANTTQAFIAEKRHSVSMHNDFGDRARKAAATRRDASGDEIEIPATASDPQQDKSSQNADKRGQSSSSAAEKGQPSTSEEAKKSTSTTRDGESRPRSAGVDTSNSQGPSGEQFSHAELERRKKQRRKSLRKKHNLERLEQEEKPDSLNEPTSPNTEPSRQESTGGSPNNKAPTPSSGKRSIFDAGKKSRQSSQLDSPGEQLSQALQESARKRSFSAVDSKLAGAEKKDKSRPSTSSSKSGGSSNVNTSTPASRPSSSGTTGSSPGRLGLGITNSPRKKKDGNSGKQGIKSSEPTLAEKLKKAKEDSESSKKTSDISKVSNISVEDTPLPSVEKPKQAAKDEARGGAINLEEQCGVILNDGKLCGKPLGRKCHAKSLQRAVPGRSRPLDAILSDLKKAKNGTQTPKQASADNNSKSKVAAISDSKAKDGKSVGTKLPDWGLDHDSATVLQASVPQGAPVAARVSSSKIVPVGMTEEEFECLTKSGTAKPVSAKLTKKKVSKETSEPAPPPPKIKVSEDSGSGSSSSSKSRPEASDLEVEKETASEKKSTKQSPADKKTINDDAKLKTPKSNLMRESTTPGSDFDEITSKLKSIRHSSSSDAIKLESVAPKSTQKKKDALDRKSSATSYETPKPDINKSVLSVTASNASKSTKPTSSGGHKTTDKATPQTAKREPKPGTPAASSTSSLKRKASPVTASKAPPISGLRKLKAELQAKSREASKRNSPVATPTHGMSLSNQGQKKVFDDSDESSSSESESSSSDDSDDGGKVMLKKGVKGKGSPSAVPDRTIRDPTPDVDSSDED